MRKSGLTLDSILANGMPPVSVDPHLIEETALNLLNNAGEAMKTMEAGKKIIVSSAVEKNQVIIRVSDSGPGVSEEIRHKIFDPYFTTKPEGTGIGLSLSHRIITDHGGTLTVTDSNLGGAEFRISIPVKRLDGR
jgi:signal transduction histidine kinase